MNNLAINSVNNKTISPTPINGVLNVVPKPLSEVQQTDSEDVKEKNKKKLGFALVTTALGIGIGTFLLTRMLSKKSILKFNTIYKKLDDKLAELAENKHLTGAQKIYSSTLKGAKKLLSKTPTIFNVATLKDLLFVKSMKIHPVLIKCNDAITNAFEKVSRMTSNIAYIGTQRRFEKMYADFAVARQKLPNEQAEIIEKKLKNIRENYYQGFSEEARNARFAQVKQDLNGLDERVWEKTYKNPKNLANEAMKGVFIAEAEASTAKFKYNGTINGFKEKITTNVYDNYHATNKLVNGIDNILDTTDKETNKLMKKLRADLNEYKKTLKYGEISKNDFYQSNLSKTLKELNKYITQSDKYDKTVVHEVSKSISEIRAVLSKDKKGEIQEIMQIYKKHLSKEDYSELKKSVSKTLKSFDMSVDLEGDKLFDKVRDLYLGSAPHDTLGFLASLGVAGWFMGKAENNDERMSVALKYGIPIVGGAAITTLCAVGLVASGPSLLIGVISGLAINKLGESADEMRKNKKKDTPIFAFPYLSTNPPINASTDAGKKETA